MVKNPVSMKQLGSSPNQLSRIEIESKKSHCFSINLVVAQNFHLNPLHKHFKITKKRPPAFTLLTIFYRLVEKFTVVYCESVNLIGYITVFYLLIENSSASVDIARHV